MPPKIATAALALLGVLIIGAAGCTRKKLEDLSLIKVKNLSMTVGEFNQAVKAAAGEAFAGQEREESRALNDLRLRILNQKCEEMMIRAYAAERQIGVSDEELDKAVNAIKTEYPDNTFEEALHESAVSYQFWRNQLSVRLLIERVIDKELAPAVQISPAEVAEYQKKVYPQGAPERGDAEALDKRITAHLRRQKTEAAFKQWMEGLRRSYPVELNQAAWNDLVGGVKP